MEVTKEDLNGLGKRLGSVELLKPKVARNEEDIQKVFTELSKIPEQNQKLLNKIFFVVILSLALSTWAIIAKDSRVERSDKNTQNTTE